MSRNKPVPLADRSPRFNSQWIGCLSNVEFDFIDMSVRLSIRDAGQLGSYLYPSSTPFEHERAMNACIRLLNRMTHAGLTTGPPSAFKLTPEALVAYEQADAWLLDPFSRPKKPKVSRRRIVTEQLRMEM